MLLLVLALTVHAWVSICLCLPACLCPDRPDWTAGEVGRAIDAYYQYPRYHTRDYWGCWAGLLTDRLVCGGLLPCR